MKYLITIVITIIVTYATAFGIYNFLPVNYLTIESSRPLGATITTILSTDRLSDSRGVINTNFANLNENKIEMSTTSVASITTLSNLVTVGTIGTGVWEGTDVTVANGGTGLSTLTANAVMLGAGSSNVNFVSGLGSSGQFLTSNGAASDPTWTTSSISLSDNYTWTGVHNFTNATTYIVGLNASSTLILNGVTYRYPSVEGASSTVLSTDGSADLSWNVMFTGWERVVATSSACSTSDNVICTVTVTCTGNREVLGGGGFLSTQEEVHMTRSYPSADNEWTYQTEPQGNVGAHTISAHALCADTDN